MSFIYSTNSPEYLNYIASTKTRDDIKNDPSLCVLFEDPYIKDEVELAFKYQEAINGDYEAKKEYVGFYLANGPELDTETLMYHREKILLNPAIHEVYRANFKDIEVVWALREEKYNKPVVHYSSSTYNTEDDRSSSENKNDLLDCLQNPCDYLGPFSSTIGIVGDKKNVNTISNVFSRITDSAKDTEENYPVWGNIREHMIGKIVPEVEHGYHQMIKFMSKLFGDLGKSMKEAGVSQNAQVVGDKKAEEKVEKVAALVKTQVVSQLGDCARIWERMRRLRNYDPSKNTKRPFDTSANIKNADGTIKRTYQTQSDTSLKPSGLTFTYGGEGKTWVYTKPEKDKPAKPTTSNWTPPFPLTQPTGVDGAYGINALGTIDNSDIAGRIIIAGQNVGKWCIANNIWFHGHSKNGKVQYGRKLERGEGTGLTWISPVATDCSGGVFWVLSEAGLIKNPLGGAPGTPTYRNDWSRFLVDGYKVIQVQKEQLQKGDIILWDRGRDRNNHVSIYVSPGCYIDFGNEDYINKPQPANRPDPQGVINKVYWRIVPVDGAAPPAAPTA